jgi:hypothetical protein
MGLSLVLGFGRLVGFAVLGTGGSSLISSMVALMISMVFRVEEIVL